MLKTTTEALQVLGTAASEATEALDGLAQPQAKPVHNRASRRRAGQFHSRRIGTLTARGALRVKPLEQVEAERALRLANRRLDRAGT